MPRRASLSERSSAEAALIAADEILSPNSEGKSRLREWMEAFILSRSGHPLPDSSMSSSRKSQTDSCQPLEDAVLRIWSAKSDTTSGGFSQANFFDETSDATSPSCSGPLPETETDTSFPSISDEELMDHTLSAEDSADFLDSLLIREEIIFSTSSIWSEIPKRKAIFLALSVLGSDSSTPCAARYANDAAACSGVLTRNFLLKGSAKAESSNPAVSDLSVAWAVFLMHPGSDSDDVKMTENSSPESSMKSKGSRRDLTSAWGVQEVPSMRSGTDLFGVNKVLMAAGVNPGESGPGEGSFRCPLHPPGKGKTLTMSSLGGVRHFRCGICGPGAVGPLWFLSRTRGISIREAADFVRSSGGFFGTDDMLGAHTEMEVLQKSAVDAYLESLSSGTDMPAEWAASRGEDFFTRGFMAAEDLEDRMGGRIPGFSDFRGRKSPVSVRILWSMAGSPAELLVEAGPSGPVRRIRLDRQPEDGKVLLSMPLSSAHMPWSGGARVLAFLSDGSARRMWPWASQAVAADPCPVVAVHSVCGAPESCCSMGEVDALLHPDESPMAAFALSLGPKCDVRVVRLAPGVEDSSDPSQVLSMESRSAWRHRTMASPADDASSRIAALSRTGRDAEAALLVSEVCGSRLLSAGEKDWILSRAAAEGDRGAREALAESASSVPLSGSGFVLLPTPDGYLMRSSSRKPEPDRMVSDFRLMPVATVRGGARDSRILKGVCRDGAQFFVHFPAGTKVSPAKFSLAVSRAAESAGARAVVSDSRAARAMAETVYMAHASGGSEVSSKVGFLGGSMVSPSDALSPGSRPAPGLVEWIHAVSLVPVPGRGWREDLSAVVAEDLSSGFSEGGGAGPAALLMLAMAFLSECSSSAGNASLTVESEEILAAMSSVSGILLAGPEALAAAESGPMDVSSVPVCVPGRALRDVPTRFVASCLSRFPPGVESMSAAGIGRLGGFSTEMPAPDLQEVSDAACSERPWSAAAAMLLLPRGMVRMLESVHRRVSPAAGGGVPGFVAAFVALMSSDEGRHFVVASRGGELVVEKAAIGAACRMAGIPAPSERAATRGLAAAGVCRSTTLRASYGGPRTRFLLVDPEALDGTPNVVEARFG